MLDVRRETAETLARLLRAHRCRLGTRENTRALGAFKQAVLVLRWFVGGTRLAQLARDNGISGSWATSAGDPRVGVELLRVDCWVGGGGELAAFYERQRFHSHRSLPVRGMAETGVGLVSRLTARAGALSPALSHPVGPACGGASATSATCTGSSSHALSTIAAWTRPAPCATL